MTRPDSGEREVGQWACGKCGHWNRGLYCSRCPVVPVPLSLAQRILAALDGMIEYWPDARDLRALASELRERMPR